MPRSLRFRLGIGAALSAVAVAGASFTLIPSAAAMISSASFSAAPSTTVEQVDVGALQAQREADLHSRSIAVDIRLGNLRALEAQQVAEMGYDPKTADSPREIARQIMANKYGWGDSQFSCYDSIIMRESKWNPRADNPTSSAYGIPQALPGNKMASAGADWRTNPATQIKWGLGYVKSRYGTPCQAWTFKRAHGWY